MSKASKQADTKAETWVERRQHWIAAITSALVHLLFVLAMWLSPPITVSTPQGTAGGSRTVVDFIGETPPQPPTPVPPATKPAASKPAARSRTKSRVQTTAVAHSDDPVPDDTTETTDAPDIPTPTPPAPPAATPPPTPQRRSHTWGQPPGMLPENMAPENAGMARSSSTDRGRRNDSATGQISMEVGGYQVYYDLRSEIRLRAWREQGMTEIFLPLPGTRRYMVCPLETALRQESGACRLLEPDSPELKTIGDAREVINMQRVYRQGEVVWRGPGAYR